VPVPRGKHITDTLAAGIAKTGRNKGAADVPGPSTNPATNALIHDIALRSAGRIARLAIEKGMLGKRYGTEIAKQAVENRSLLHTVAAYGVTKIATRSVPGAVLVGSGLIVKTLYDRSRSRRAARLAGDKAIAKQAEE
jgi:hypothetical protein